MATELTSGAITNILEAVPGIATVLRSPVADAIVNLSRAAAGIAPFDPKDARELIRYAVRRGLIRSDEGDRVEAEIDAAAKGLPVKVAAPVVKKPAPKPVHGLAHRAAAHRPTKPAAKKPAAKRPAARHPKPKKK